MKEAFNKTGETPKIGKLANRPRKPFEYWKIQLFKKIYDKHRASAEYLQKLIDKNKQNP